MGQEEVRAALREKFTKLTPDDFKNSAGSRDALAKVVAEKEGISEEDARKQIDEVFTANQ